MKKIIGAIAIMFLIIGIGLVSAHGEGDTDYDGHHGMMDGLYGWFGMGAFGWIFMILFIIVLILLVVWLANQLNQKEKRRRKR